MAWEIGAVVEGTILNITNYGLFVSLADGSIGLVHISEVSGSYVPDLRPLFNSGQVIKVKILGVNEKGKLDLSIRQTTNNAPNNRRAGKNRPPKTRARTLGDVEESRRSLELLPFEEKLARFMKESEERLLDLKKNVEAKRGKKKVKY